jgi:hypothetical protein
LSARAPSCAPSHWRGRGGRPSLRGGARAHPARSPPAAPGPALAGFWPAGRLWLPPGSPPDTREAALTNGGPRRPAGRTAGRHCSRRWRLARGAGPSKYFPPTCIYAGQSPSCLPSQPPFGSTERPLRNSTAWTHPPPALMWRRPAPGRATKLQPGVPSLQEHCLQPSCGPLCVMLQLARTSATRSATHALAPRLARRSAARRGSAPYLMPCICACAWTGSEPLLVSDDSGLCQHDAGIPNRPGSRQQLRRRTAGGGRRGPRPAPAASIAR